MFCKFFNEWRQSVCFSALEVLFRRNDRNKKNCNSSHRKEIISCS